MNKTLQTSFLFFATFFFCFSSKAQHTLFQTGDIFLGQGGGIIQRRDANGVFIININTETVEEMATEPAFAFTR